MSCPSLKDKQTIAIDMEKLTFDIEETQDSIAINFSADKSLLYRTLEDCKRFLRKQGVKKGSLDCQLVLYELLCNAVIHGCKSNVENDVFCSIRIISDTQLEIIVEDSGEGLNANAIDMTLPDDPRFIRQRGFKLINALSDRIEFNDKGNRISVFFKFSDKVIMPGNKE